MLLFRRLKPLSGVVVLLALCPATTGCRSCMPCCPDNCCGPQAGAAVEAPGPGCQPTSLGRPVATTRDQQGFQPSRPLWKLSATRCEPRPMPSGYQAGCQQCRQVACATCNPQPVTPCGGCAPPPPQEHVAMMLRPVPTGQPLPQSAGVWSPVRRVSNEAPPLAESGIQPALSASPVQPGMSFPPLPSLGEQPGAPAQLPQVPAILVAQADVGRDEPPANKGVPDKPATSKPDQLPPPRLKGGAKKAAPAGWPEIPAPVVTNPPHAPREFQKHALSAYIIEPPDVLRIDASTKVAGTSQLPIEGPHLVRPDGTIGLGTFGAVFVAGMTLDQAKMQIIEAIMRGVSQTQGGEDASNDKPEDGKKEKRDPPTLQNYWQAIRVDVAAFNSKFYYVIADGGGYGETVIRVPCTGNETVLDAISQMQGLPAVASKKKIWVARATPAGHHPAILPVDWYGITQGGSAVTNYQVFPGDRVYVNSDCRIRLDSHLAKFISPIERLFGITLLGATTVNAINGNQFGGGVP